MYSAEGGQGCRRERLHREGMGASSARWGGGQGLGVRGDVRDSYNTPPLGRRTEAKGRGKEL